ncbi:MAG: anti-sigma regulatory factor (Ser/Thr protein kinase) [Nitrospira sp.]|jgi:serine/threonine-protein kinase RsbT|nr:anti-sigma regulatory factor (Ser/Thr protein kinase) [Nitrospira sp.]
MATLRDETFAIRSSDDIVRTRQITREWALMQGFSLVDQTKIVTASSELARNTLQHGGGGEVRFEALQEGIRRGLRLTFVDKGPGIADLSLALKDGFTTASGMGLGLSGSKRLVNEFDIQSEAGKGTSVMIARWR